MRADASVPYRKRGGFNYHGTDCELLTSAHESQGFCCLGPLKASIYEELPYGRGQVRKSMVHQKPCEFPYPPHKTKPLWAPKYTSKYTPNPVPKKKTEQNSENIQKLLNFPVFAFLGYFGFGRGIEVYFEVYFGAQKGFILCRGHRNSQQKRGFRELETHMTCTNGPTQ